MKIMGLFGVKSLSWSVDAFHVGTVRAFVQH